MNNKYVYIAYYNDNEAIQSMDIFSSEKSLKEFIDNEYDVISYEEAIKKINEDLGVEISPDYIVEKRMVK